MNPRTTTTPQKKKKDHLARSVVVLRRRRRRRRREESPAGPLIQGGDQLRHSSSACARSSRWLDGIDGTPTRPRTCLADLTHYRWMHFVVCGDQVRDIRIRCTRSARRPRGASAISPYYSEILGAFFKVWHSSLEALLCPSPSGPACPYPAHAPREPSFTRLDGPNALLARPSTGSPKKENVTLDLSQARVQHVKYDA